MRAVILFPIAEKMLSLSSVHLLKFIYRRKSTSWVVSKGELQRSRRAPPYTTDHRMQMKRICAMANQTFTDGGFNQRHTLL